jgi:hypothetical protein
MLAQRRGKINTRDENAPALKQPNGVAVKPRGVPRGNFATVFLQPPLIGFVQP